MLFCWGVGAHAHDWYPADCCSGQDCKSVPREDLEELKNGCWRYLPTGSDFCGSKIRPSQDRFWHVCIGTPSEYDPQGTPHCVFIQNGS